MPRKAIPTTVSITPESLAVRPLAGDVIDLVAEHDAMQAGALAIAEQFGYDGSLSVGALEDEIRFYQRRSVEAVLALGTRLLILKELTAHGEFIQRVELLGINERMARRFMSATLKLGKTDTKSVLAAAGNQTKLLELVTLDDEDIAELANGGSAANLTLDDVARMTVTELRAALRELRENEQATGRLLAEKNAKLDDLTTQLNKAPGATEKWDSLLIGVSGEINELGVVADEIFGKHVSFIDVCEVVADKIDPDAPDYRDKLEQARVPIARLGDQIERFAHIVARLRFDFDTRVGGYLDRSHILDAADAE